MEHKSLAALFLRIAGVLVIVSILSDFGQKVIPLMPDAVQKFGVAWLIGTLVISVVLPFVIAILLIYFPGTTANGILKIKTLDAATQSDIAPLQRVAFAAIGLWLVIYGVLDVVYIVSKVGLYRPLIEDLRAYSTTPKLYPEDFAFLVRAVVQFIFGFVLLLGNRSLANLLHHLRK